LRRLPLEICLTINNNTSGSAAIAERDSQETCDNIASLSVSGAPEVTGLTTMEQEACTAVDVLAAHHVESTLVESQGDIQNLTEYFSRPRLIYSAASVAGAEGRYVEAQVTNNLVFNVWFPFGASRLIGAYGAKYTMVFTLQVAASPFAQGILGISYQYGAVDNANVTGQLNRGGVAGMQTNLPHVLLDIAENTMCQLRVPFLTTTEYDDINGVVPLGTVNLITYLPVLIGTGATLPWLKLMVHLEDMQIFGAVNPESANIVMQSSKRLPPVSEEFSDANKPISSSLYMAGQSLSYLAKGVPSLSSLIGPPAWAFGLASRVVRYFGYSKPTVTIPPKRMHLQSHANESNTDISSIATVVGPFASNSLAFGPNLGHTAVDEMALSFITSQYSQLCSGAFGTSTPVGTGLWASAVSPSYFWYRRRFTGVPPFTNIAAANLSFAATKAAFIPSHIFYVASCFRQWKGGFKLRFRFAKTKFHTGRVLVNYDPRPVVYTPSPPVVPVAAINANGPGGTPGPQPGAYSKIFDFKDGNSFDFDIPYVSNYPYRTFFENIGSMTMSLMDTVQAPSTVSNIIQFTVEIAGASDFESSILRAPAYPPVLARDISVIKYQSGKLLSTINNKAAEECIGEKIVSVKQIIQVPQWTICGVVPASSSSGNNILLPWWYGAPNLLTAAPASWPRASFNIGSYFSRAYAFVRGSSDYHFYSLNGGVADIYVAVSPSPVDSAIQGLVGAGGAPASPLPRVINTSTQVGLHVRLPAHQRVARYFSGIFFGTQWGFDLSGFAGLPTNLPYAPIEYFNLLFRNLSSAQVVMLGNRAAGDDATMASYIGPPLLGLLSAPTTGPYDPDSTGNF